MPRRWWAFRSSSPLSVDGIAGAVAARWRGRGRAVTYGLALACLGARLVAVAPARYPTVAVAGPPEPFLPTLRSGDGPLLELPAEGLVPATTAMYRSTFHWRPILNGYASFWPARHPGDMALADRLPDRDAVDALRRGTGLELVLVRLQEMPAAARPRWLDLPALEASGLELVARTPAELLFRVSAAPRVRSPVRPEPPAPR